MSKGQCLCGSVTWEISGTPMEAYHCHCSMCRKAHGAAFGTFYQMHSRDFAWTSGLDTLVDYASSPTLTRSFCGTCGSMVPDRNSDDDQIFVPAGSHDDGPEVQCHIFVGSVAPWHDISDDLTKHQTYPDDDGNSAVYPDKDMQQQTPGIIRGSCLCELVEFEVSESFKVVHNCHCSRCRKARAAAFTTNGFTPMEAVSFTKGEQHVASYKLPGAKFYTHAFCDTCGSGLPRLDPDRKIAVVPLGALDDDPQSRAVDNIFVGSKADWYTICDNLPAFEEGPTG